MVNMEGSMNWKVLWQKEKEKWNHSKLLINGQRCVIDYCLVRFHLSSTRHPRLKYYSQLYVAPRTKTDRHHRTETVFFQRCRRQCHFWVTGDKICARSMRGHITNHSEIIAWLGQNKLKVWHQALSIINNNWANPQASIKWRFWTHGVDVYFCDPNGATRSD